MKGFFIMTAHIREAWRLFDPLTNPPTALGPSKLFPTTVRYGPGGQWSTGGHRVCRSGCREQQPRVRIECQDPAGKARFGDHARRLLAGLRIYRLSWRNGAISMPCDPVDSKTQQLASRPRYERDASRQRTRDGRDNGEGGPPLPLPLSHPLSS